MIEVIDGEDHYLFNPLLMDMQTIDATHVWIKSPTLDVVIEMSWRRLKAAVLISLKNPDTITPVKADVSQDD